MAGNLENRDSTVPRSGADSARDSLSQEAFSAGQDAVTGNTLQRYASVTGKGIENIPNGILKTIEYDGTHLGHTAKIIAGAAMTGGLFRAILAEGGPVAKSASLLIGGYLLAKSASPIIDAYGKAGSATTQFEMDGAARELGDAAGAFVFDGLIAGGGYKIGSGLVSKGVHSPGMTDFLSTREAVWKGDFSRVNPFSKSQPIAFDLAPETLTLSRSTAPMGVSAYASEVVSRSAGVVPPLAEVARPAAGFLPTAPEFVSRATELVPTSPGFLPRAPEIAPAAQGAVPHASEVTPQGAEVVPQAPTPVIPYNPRGHIGGGDEGTVYSNGDGSISKVWLNPDANLAHTVAMFDKLESLPNINVPRVLEMGRTIDGKPALRMEQIGDGSHLQEQLLLGEIPRSEIPAVQRQYDAAAKSLQDAGLRIDWQLKNMIWDKGKLYIVDPSFMKNEPMSQWTIEHYRPH